MARQRSVIRSLNPRKRARGLSFPGLLIGLVAFVLMITLVLKLGPHYLDWQTMKSIFENLPESEVREMDSNAIREKLAKQFRVNSLRDFKLRDLVIIDNSKEATVLTVSYERRENIVSNIDVVLVFTESYKYQ
jgi:hypothetical protein